MKKVVVIFFVVILFILGGVIYIDSSNNSYKTSLEKKVKENYNNKIEIKKLNKYGKYYIIMTEDELIALDSKYKELKIVSIVSLPYIDDKFEIVYFNNDFAYLEKQEKKGKYTYIYYDINSGEVIKKIFIGGLNGK